MSTTVQFELPPGEDKEDRPRHDAIELLTRPINIRRPRKNDREFIRLAVGPQAHIAGGPRYRIRRARIERRGFLDEAFGAAIDLWRRHVDVAIQKIHVTQALVQP